MPLALYSANIYSLSVSGLTSSKAKFGARNKWSRGRPGENKRGKNHDHSPVHDHVWKTVYDSAEENEETVLYGKDGKPRDNQESHFVFLKSIDELDDVRWDCNKRAQFIDRIEGGIEDTRCANKEKT